MAETHRWNDIRGELEARPGYSKTREEARRQLAQEDAAYFHSLGEARRARQLTQVEIARRLKIAQPSVSKLERQADLYISTLRKYIEAMGGVLEMRAIFPEDEAILDFDSLEHIDEDNPEEDATVHPIEAM